MDALTSISPKMAASLAQTKNRPADLQSAAEQFEALFIHQLLKQARSAKLAEDILGSEAADTYTEMLDQERAKQAKYLEISNKNYQHGHFEGQAHYVKFE